MTNSNNKKLIIIVAVATIAIIAIVSIFAFQTTESIDNKGIKAEYKLRGDILKISAETDDQASGNWYISLGNSEDEKVNALESKSASNVMVKLSLEGLNDAKEICLYFEENGAVTKDIFLIAYLDNRGKICIRDFKAGSQKDYIDTVQKVTKNIPLPDGVIITNAINDSTGEMSEISFIFEGKKYVYILSEKVKFSKMLNGLSEKMEELEISKITQKVGDVEVKGYSYENDGKFYNICYWIDGETRCYLSSEEASFDELLDFVKNSNKV